MAQRRRSTPNHSGRAQETLRVLLVGGKPEEVYLLRELLVDHGAFHFELDRCASAARARTASKTRLPDLILLSSPGAGKSRDAAVKRIRSEFPALPLILLGGRKEERFAYRAIQQGAQDFLLREQLESQLLVRTIHHAIERGRIKARLAAETNLMRVLLECLPDPIYFKDRESRFIRISSRLAKLFNLQSAADAIGKSDFDFFPEQVARPFYEDEQRIMRTGKPLIDQVQDEKYLDGETAVVVVTKMPLRDDAGRIIGTFGISHDVTDFKRMEERLETERNILRSLIENVPDVIFVKDREGRYIADNVAHRRVLRVKAEADMLGRTALDFFPESDARKFHEQDIEIMRSGETVLGREELVSDARGERRWNSTTKAPMRNAQGEVVGLVGIRHDIHDRVVAQEALREANADLQRSHRELQAAQMHLIEAEKLQSVGRLAAGIAHEVKNPLATIKMGLEFLSQQAMPAESPARGVIDEMSEAINRADRVIRELLDFSSARKLNLAPVEINTLIDRSLWLVNHEFRAAKIEVVRNLTRHLPEVRVDPLKIEQVLVNVFINAAHAMPAGGRVEIRTLLSEGGGTRKPHDEGDRSGVKARASGSAVVIEVRDTGPGVKQEELAKLFDPFFTTKPTGKGTGLGLTVARKIIELHNGMIDIRNHPMGGAVVTITLDVRGSKTSGK